MDLPRVLAAMTLGMQGFSNFFRDIRILEVALGDGVKRVFPGELSPLGRLRRIDA
jgi:N-acetylneuraminate synthase